MSTLKLLASNNFITVNKTLMLSLGIDEAIMIGELASEYDYWETKEQLDEDGFFYSTVEKVEENTTLTKYKQKKALDKLQKLGIVEVQRKGLPAKRYVKIHEEKLLQILSNKKSKNLTSGSKKILPLEVKKFDRNNNINNNNINNNKEREIKKRENAKRFSPPTVQEVKEYCLERGNNIDAEKFVEFYQSKGWKVGTSKMTDWKASIRLWERRDKSTDHYPNNNTSCTEQTASYNIEEYENNYNIMDYFDF